MRVEGRGLLSGDVGKRRCLSTQVRGRQLSQLLGDVGDEFHKKNRNKGSKAAGRGAV